MWKSRKITSEHLETHLFTNWPGCRLSDQARNVRPAFGTYCQIIGGIIYHTFSSFLSCSRPPRTMCVCVQISGCKVALTACKLQAIRRRDNDFVWYFWLKSLRQTSWNYSTLIHVWWSDSEAFEFKIKSNNKITVIDRLDFTRWPLINLIRTDR